MTKTTELYKNMELKLKKTMSKFFSVLSAGFRLLKAARNFDNHSIFYITSNRSKDRHMTSSSTNIE